MSFKIGKTFDREKVFLVRLSETAGRLDPAFHRPYFRRCHTELDSSSFPVVALGSLKGRIFQGVGRNLVEGAPTQLLKVKNITTDGQIDFTATEPVVDVPKSKLLKRGDIISPFIGAAIKGYKFAKFDGSEQPYTADNNTGIIRITDDRVSPDYLYTFCQTGMIRWQLDQLTGGGGVPFLGSEYARRIRLPVPSDKVQSAAIKLMQEAKLRRADSLEKARTLLLGVDDMLLAELGITLKPAAANTIESRMFLRRFSSVTGNRIDPASNWKVLSFGGGKFPLRKLREVATINPPTRFGKIKGPDTVSFVPMDAVSDILAEIADHQTRPAGDVGSYTPFQEGDLIWAKITPCMENGKSAVARGLENGFGYGSTEFHVFRPKAADVTVDFLHHLLRLQIVRQHARLNFTGSSGHQRVDEQFFRRMTIPVPPAKVQERIVAKADLMKLQARKHFQNAAEVLEAARREIEALILTKGPVV